MPKIRRRKAVDEVMPAQVVELEHGSADEVFLPHESVHEPNGNMKVICPRCRSLNTFVQTTRPSEHGFQLRYMRCRSCRMSFKDVRSSNGNAG